MGLEERLRRRHATRTERFAHGDFRVEILLPLSADGLIDESEYGHDERLPYWADLWPSARALARFLLDGPPPPGRVLELGCGVALPSLALASLGIRAMATDYYQEALDFARVNALRNEIAPPESLLLDWRAPPEGLGHFDLVLAADVLYERRNAESLAALLPRVAAPSGRVWIADPGRAYRAELEERMVAVGWRVREIALLVEPATDTTTSTIRIWEMVPPPGDQRGPPKL